MNVLERLINDVCLDQEWKAATYLLQKGRLEVQEAHQVALSLMKKAREAPPAAAKALLAGHWYLMMCAGTKADGILEGDLIECARLSYKYLRESLQLFDAARKGVDLEAV